MLFLRSSVVFIIIFVSLLLSCISIYKLTQTLFYVLFASIYRVLTLLSALAFITKFYSTYTDKLSTYPYSTV